jgi:electron transfer flavoprotein beta subunit
MPLNIIVCCKQVSDPEAPPASFKVAGDKMTVPPDVKPVVSPYDENAIEAALKVKEAVGGKITAISMGNELIRDVIKKPLSVGSDELILLEDPNFEGGDSWTTANALAAAIKKVGEYDLIFCGRQSADWNAGQVGLGIAEILGIPAVSVVRKVEVIDGKVKLERAAQGGYEVVEVELPALLTITSEFGDLRYAALKGIMRAAKIQPTVWKPADIGLEPSQVGAAARRAKLVKLFQPVKETECDMIEGDTPAEAGANLAAKLREVKIL